MFNAKRIDKKNSPLFVNNLGKNIRISELEPKNKIYNIQRYLEHIKYNNVREPVFRLVLVHKEDETPYAVLDDWVSNTDGSLEISLNEGTRRTVSFNIINIDSRFTKMFQTMSLGSKFKLYLGEIINGEEMLFPQGVFVFDNPSINVGISENIINISGTDKWSMLDGTNGGIIQMPYKITQGSKLGDIVTDTIALNICNDAIVPIIEDKIYDFEIPYDIEKSSGDNIASILLEVALCANAYMYYDENGHFVAKQIEYDAYKATQHHFIYRQDINYIDCSVNFDYQGVFNSVFLEADNAQNEEIPITAYAVNTDLTDPNSVPNVGYNKWKQITEYTEGIANEQMAQERVNYELRKVASLSTALNITARPIYFLCENNIITLTDERVGCNNKRFLVNSISMPLTYNGNMIIGGSRAMGYIEKDGVLDGQQ